MTTLEELRAQAAALAAEIDALVALDHPTEEQTARFEEAMREMGPLAEQIRGAATPPAVPDSPATIRRRLADTIRRAEEQRP